MIYPDALRFVLRWEGGYVNHPNDPGGATNKGITQATYNRYRQGKPTRSVRRITMDEVGAIYRNRYWKVGHCDELPDMLAFAHFDWCVNTGPRRAIKHLQEVVGTVVDGKWGPNSARALAESIERDDVYTVTQAYMDRRERYYRWLGGRPRFRVFLDGWLNRLSSLRVEIEKLRGATRPPCA